MPRVRCSSIPSDGEDGYWNAHITRRPFRISLASKDSHSQLMKQCILISLFAAAALTLQAQLPPTSAAKAGFDLGRLEIAHATVQRFVDEGKHAGIIMLLARDGKIADLQAYGYRDVEQKLPMQRDTICRIYSMSK